MMLKKAITLVTCIVTCIFSHAQTNHTAQPTRKLLDPPTTMEARNFVGVRYKRTANALPEKLPFDCKNMGDSDKLSPQNALGMIEVICQGHRVILLEEFVGIDSSNPKQIEVAIVDQLVAPLPLVAGQGFSHDVGADNDGCYAKGNRKSKPISLIGFYSLDVSDKPGSNVISDKLTVRNGGLIQGWVLNAAIKKIEPAPQELMQSLVCYQVVGDI